MHDGARPLILGIETSCDETAAAVVTGGTHVLSSIVAGQTDLHARYRGVVPEVASRAHLENILPVVREAMTQASCTYDDLDAIAVGHRPGLIGSLLVGVSAAKGLAWSLGKPVIGVDHVEAHLYAGLLDAAPVPFPAIGLVVSGGHSCIFTMEAGEPPRLIGRTIDDAVGEAFDKVAAMLGLEFPGGPAVERLARDGRPDAFDFPIGLVERDRLDFSFSGLKTAVLYAVRGVPQAPNRPAREAPPPLTAERCADIAASFQRAAIAAITRKLERAIELHEPRSLLVGGGVSANGRLREALSALASKHALDLRLPAMRYCVDNAAMIAGAAAERVRRGEQDGWELSAQPLSAVARTERVR